MKKTPILFIDWFDNDEEHDAVSFTNRLHEETVEVLDPSPDQAGKERILQEAQEWANGNRDAQLLIISSHGNANEIGPAKTEVGLTYVELFDLMRSLRSKCGRSLELLLLGCNTASAKATFESSEHPALQPVIRGFVGFDEKPSPSNVRDLLSILAGNLAKLDADYIVKTIGQVAGGTPRGFIFVPRNGKMSSDEVAVDRTKS